MSGGRPLSPIVARPPLSKGKETAEGQGELIPGPRLPGRQLPRAQVVARWGRDTASGEEGVKWAEGSVVKRAG